MASRIDDASLGGNKLDSMQENQSSATSFSITTNDGLLAATPRVNENLSEPLNLPNFSQSETAEIIFQEDEMGQDVESGGSEQQVMEPLIKDKAEQSLYNKEKLSAMDREVKEWYENTSVTAVVVTFFEGHIRVLAPDHMSDLKRYAEFKEIFLKTLLRATPPSNGQKTMNLVSKVNQDCEEDVAITCDKCCKQFQNKNQLSSHQLLVHMPKEASEHRCNKCGKVFQAAAFLQTHLCNRSGQRDHECQICKTRFTTGSSLKMHMRIHSDDKPYTCQTCGQGFPRRSSLNYHITKHTGEREYQCKTCGKEFALLNNLRDHERIHSGERPFSCQECGKSFTVSSTLRRHLLTHSGEKPYPCTVCSSRFTRLIHLQAHMRVHSGDRPFKCSECDKGFSQSSHLRRHKKIHEREKSQNCEKCGAEFSKDTNGMPHLCVPQNTDQALRQLSFPFFDKQFLQT